MTEKWQLLCGGLVWGVITLYGARRLGWLRPFQVSTAPMVRGIHVWQGFAWFVFMELLLVPALAVGWLVLSGRGADYLFELGWRGRGWLNVCTLLGGALGVWWAYRGLPAEQRRQLWRPTDTPPFRNLIVGAISWFCIYPWVLSFSQAISLISWHFFDYVPVEQLVVQHLRKIWADPLLFAVTGVLVVTVVPWMEEVLFRGLLQNWLKQAFSRPVPAILSTSAVFALFHYSYAQGAANVEVLMALFPLSCALGYIYERQRSLWAAVGLHGFFNLMSLVMIAR